MPLEVDCKQNLLQHVFAPCFTQTAALGPDNPAQHRCYGLKEPHIGSGVAGVCSRQKLTPLIGRFCHHYVPVRANAGFVTLALAINVVARYPDTGSDLLP